MSKIRPLLFGGDINVYSVARAFHEAFGVKSIAYSKFEATPSRRSKIVEQYVDPLNENFLHFLEHVRTTSEKFANDDIIVLGCGDAYADMISKFKSKLPSNCFAPCPSKSLVDSMRTKADFYAKMEEYHIDIPKTFVHEKHMGDVFKLDFDPPYICKPSSSIEYWKHPFDGNDKVFKLDTFQELLDTMHKIYASGYNDKIIVQEFVPGDDSAMHVLTCYSDTNGRVKMMCPGHVLLEEHSPHALGNHAVIVNEDRYPLMDDIADFLENEGYTGFSNFDIKFDERDGKHKVFELNFRQGRSNFYVTASGANIAELVVDDMNNAFGREERSIACDEMMMSVIGVESVLKHVNEKYIDQVRLLAEKDAVFNPLDYEHDKSLLRSIWLGHDIKRREENFDKYDGLAF